MKNKYAITIDAVKMECQNEKQRTRVLIFELTEKEINADCIRNKLLKIKPGYVIEFWVTSIVPLTFNR